MPPANLVGWRAAPKIRVAALAFVAYGIWAGAVNARYGAHAALLAAFIQGVLSVVITLTLATLVEVCFAAVPSRRWDGLAVILPICSVILAMAGLHVLVGTEAVVAAILPSVIIGTAFCALRVRTLRTLEKHRRQANDGSRFTKLERS